MDLAQSKYDFYRINKKKRRFETDVLSVACVAICICMRHKPPAPYQPNEMTASRKPRLPTQ